MFKYRKYLFHTVFFDNVNSYEIYNNHRDNLTKRFYYYLPAFHCLVLFITIEFTKFLGQFVAWYNFAPTNSKCIQRCLIPFFETNIFSLDKDLVFIEYNNCFLYFGKQFSRYLFV